MEKKISLSNKKNRKNRKNMKKIKYTKQNNLLNFQLNEMNFVKVPEITPGLSLLVTDDNDNVTELHFPAIIMKKIMSYMDKKTEYLFVEHLLNSSYSYNFKYSKYFDYGKKFMEHSKQAYCYCHDKLYEKSSKYGCSQCLEEMSFDEEEYYGYDNDCSDNDWSDNDF